MNFTPTSGSGKPSPTSGSASPLQWLGPEAGEGGNVVSVHDTFVDDLIAAVGKASPTAPGKHLKAIADCAEAMARKLDAAGFTRAVALGLISEQAVRLVSLGHAFPSWGPDGVRGAVNRAIRKAAGSGVAATATSDIATASAGEHAGPKLAKEFSHDGSHSQL